MTTKERIAKAQVSSNLGEVPPDEIGDIDIVRAAGMCGQSNPLGLSIWRWRYSGDQREVFRVAEGLVALGHPARVVYEVLQHLSADTCPTCLGRGFMVIKGAPVLSDEICLDCRGTGRLEIKGDEQGRLVEIIARLEREIASALMRKLNRQLDL